MHNPAQGQVLCEHEITDACLCCEQRCTALSTHVSRTLPCHVPTHWRTLHAHEGLLSLVRPACCSETPPLASRTPATNAPAPFLISPHPPFCPAHPPGKPNIFDPKGRAKWDAWEGQKGKAQEQAMEEYIM